MSGIKNVQKTTKKNNIGNSSVKKNKSQKKNNKNSNKNIKNINIQQTSDVRKKSNTVNNNNRKNIGIKKNNNVKKVSNSKKNNKNSNKNIKNINIQQTSAVRNKYNTINNNKLNKNNNVKKVNNQKSNNKSSSKKNANIQKTSDVRKKSNTINNNKLNNNVKNINNGNNRNKDDNGFNKNIRNDDFNNQSNKNWLKYIIILIIMVFAGSVLYILYDVENDFNNEIIDKVEEVKVSIEEIKTYYSDFVKLKSGSSLYIKEGDIYTEVSNVVGEIEITLDASYEVIDEYFKILNTEYYVKYDNVSKIEGLTPLNNEYKYYKNYIPYNENIVLKDNSKLFVDDINYYEVDSDSYPIIIKDTDRYGIEFNNRLVYVNKNDVLEVISAQNTMSAITDGISVLNYHFVVSAEEMKSCAQSICLREDKFDSQIKYLKDNNYYSVSMRDLELFIDGKIQLPKNSVSITIDDGWYVARAITVLEKYQMLGTLFLIGSLETPLAYASEYLEIHSHGWSIHGGNDCPSTGWRGGLHCFDRERVLDDLRKSRESLDNTPYFCYPFYEVSNRGIDLLKEAGFTMAFAGQKSDSKVRVGQDKFRIPRYVIYGSTCMNAFISYVD